MAPVDVPFGSCAQWKDELVKRQLLSNTEDIVLAGKAVLRRLRCFPQKLLLLTDAPRLLVLNPIGTGLVRDIDLSCAQKSHPDTLLNAESAFDFLLDDGRGVLRCFDNHHGSKEWAMRISVAQKKLASVGRLHSS